jgi:hypothetical protein
MLIRKGSIGKAENPLFLICISTCIEHHAEGGKIMKSITRLFVVMVVLLVFSVPAFGDVNLNIETHSYNNPIFLQDIQNLTAPDKVSYGAV